MRLTAALLTIALAASAARAIEPNNSFDTATNVAFGNWLATDGLTAGTIQKGQYVGGDVDYFRFTGLSAGHKYTAQSFGPGFTIDLLLYQLTSATVVADLDNNGLENHIDQITDAVPTNGQLTFAVTGHGDFDDDTHLPTGAHPESGTYWLRLFDQSAFGADLDNNGRVDAADLAVWKLAYKSSPAGDADHDADSDGSDFLLWQRQFRKSTAVSAIPEPATAGLILAAGVSLAAVPRGKRPWPRSTSS